MANRYRVDDRIFVVDVIIEGAHATGEHELSVVIPEKAIILRVVEDAVELTGTTDDTGTIELLLGSGGTAITAANAMPAAGVTETVLSATGLGTKLSSAKRLVASITTRAMSSGKVRYFIEYMYGV